MGEEFKNSETPLLESSSTKTETETGTASAIQTLGNIMVSIVGTGILGLPFAFRVSGWFAGFLGVTIAGTATYYCMFLLVQCKDRLARQELTQETKTYGDLGYKCMGSAGRYLTEALIFISQCGGAVASMVFIGQNLSSIFEGQGVSLSTLIFLLVPIQISLSWIGSLSSLAPFSTFANVCNVLAIAIVVKNDIEKVLSGEFGISNRKAMAGIGGLPFAGGMAVFCFDGIGMTLALEASMKEKHKFPSLLGQAVTGIMFVYVLFGFSGYMAYGDETKDIITLNLPHNWSSIAVQLGLCLAMTFTLPIVLHPIHEIVEGKLKKGKWFQMIHYKDDEDSTSILGRFGIYVSRAISIIALAILASFAPRFGVFASLVGSSVCAFLSFVLPATFHLSLLGPSLPFWQRALDYCILISGLLFASYGTYNTIAGV